jgi:predicted PurR-regulated permease PerM
MTQTLNDKIKQLSFYILLVFLFVLLFWQMAVFLPAILGAITFYALMRNNMHTLIERKWNYNLAAAVLILLSFLIVVVPLGLLLQMLYSKIGDIVKNADQFMASLTKFTDSLEKKTHMKLLSPENLQKGGGMVASFLPKMLSASFNGFTSVLLMYFMLYFMLIKSREIEDWLYEYIPFKDSNVRLLGVETKRLIISNALGVPLTALMQGVVGGLGYWLLGVPDPLFWFAITAIGSMFPFIGSALGYVPACIILFASGKTLNGTLLLAYGVVIIGLTDNVFRFLFQKKLGDVHPLVTVFGVIIGLNLFGFIGLIFGPILISIFILLIKIYMNEFVKKRTPTQNELDVHATPEPASPAT